jgi:hypothetical protein
VAETLAASAAFVSAVAFSDFSAALGGIRMSKKVFPAV